MSNRVLDPKMPLKTLRIGLKLILPILIGYFIGIFNRMKRLDFSGQEMGKVTFIFLFCLATWVQAQVAEVLASDEGAVRRPEAPDEVGIGRHFVTASL
jgi:hypothetical protein